MTQTILKFVLILLLAWILVSHLLTFYLLILQVGNWKDKSLSEEKIHAATMDPHEQHLKVALALEGSLAALNNQIKHFLFASQLKQVSKQTSAQMCSVPLKSQLLLKRKGSNRNATNTEMLVTP